MSMKVKEVLPQVEETVPKLKTFLDNTNGIIEALPTKRQLGLGVLGIGLIVKEVLPQVEETVPKLKTFLDNTNGIIEALPTKRQLGLGVLRISLIVGIAIWLYNGNALDKKASKEKKANKDDKIS
ncbi:unnamed protein product [Prunus brigantina]